MPAGKYLSEATEREIVKMAKAGYSASRIKERFGIHLKTVYAVLKRNNFSYPSRGRKLNYTFGE